jgi:two-component system, sensor histidine kinase LadS
MPQMRRKENRACRFRQKRLLCKAFAARLRIAGQLKTGIGAGFACSRKARRIAQAKAAPLQRATGSIRRKTQMQATVRPIRKASVLICLLAFGLLLACGARPAFAELIESTALLRDETAQMSVDTAAQAHFTATSNTVSLGYSQAAFWLRLRIMPAADGGETVLLVRPAILDDVKFYRSNGAVYGAAITPVLRYKQQDADWPSSVRGFRISPPKGGADYYIRIQSTGTISANFTALPRHQAHQLTFINETIYIFYLTILIVLLFWSSRKFLRTREAMFGWYAVMQFSWLFHNFFAYGYFTILVPEIDRHTIITIFRCAIIVSAALSIKFHQTVLRRFEPAAWAMRIFDLLMGIVLLALVIFWTVDHNIGLKLNAYSIACAPLLFLICGITAKTEASTGLAAMRWVYTFFSIVLLLWVLAFFGHGGFMIFALYGFMIQGLASGVLMFAILELHDRNTLAAARAAARKIATMQDQRQVQLVQNQTMAQFIDMLGHEARNTLAVVNMSISGPKISAAQRTRVSEAISALTEVIDRCYQAIQLDSQTQSINTSNCDLAELLRKLCGGHLQSARIALTAPDQAWLQSDPTLLAVIFGNLIDNAVKYSLPDSLVRVDLRWDPQGINVVIENQIGPAGLPDPAQVFQKYYRNPRAKAEIGAGIGLYIVRGLVHLLAGKISYRPAKEHVIFKVALPC